MRSRVFNLTLLIGFSGLFLAFVGGLARIKPLWYDELLTYHLARLESVSLIWSALANGPDNSPPFNLLATHAIYRFAGHSPVATRLTAMLGVWVMTLCLYVFVARRCGPVYGWIALLFPLTTMAQSYAYEGRPYGLWLGLCGLALICWQAAIGTSRWRPLPLVGLTLSLTGAVSTHFYAPIGFIPFGLAELVRTWRRRRIDVPMWIALVAGLVPMAFFGPLLRNARADTDVFFSQPGLAACLVFYTWLLSTALPALVAACALLGADALFTSSRSTQTPENPPAGRVRPPLEEIVAAFGFAGFPVFAMMLSRVAARGAFVERYSLPAVMGFAVLVAFFAFSFGRRRRTGYILAIALLGGAAYVGRMDGQLVRVKNAAHSQQLGKVVALKGLPIASDDPLFYVVLHYYAPSELNSRLTYLTGIAKDQSDRALNKLAQWITASNPFQIENYTDFVSAHRRFFLCFGASAAGGSLVKRSDSLGLRFDLKEFERAMICEAVPAEETVPSSAEERRKTAPVGQPGSR
jgi:hypothetical protein